MRSGAPRRGSAPGVTSWYGFRALLWVLLWLTWSPLAGGSAAWAGSGPLDAQVLLTQDEALELAFPSPATVERRSAFLEPPQLERARRLAGPGVTVDQEVLTYYVGIRNGRPVGVAYFDVHRVRTMREVVMIVVDQDDRIERVEVLRFAEPPDYMASDQWIAQLEGRTLDPELQVDRGIINMTGATLTSGALTRASRRILALHRVIEPFGATGRAGR